MKCAFVRLHVGLSVGFWDSPDMRQSRAINNFEANCRVCRVPTGVESPGESTGNHFASNRESVDQLNRAGDR
jgi:hypothetical protein